MSPGAPSVVTVSGILKAPPDQVPEVLEPVLVALLVPQAEVDQDLTPVPEDGPRSQDAFFEPGLLPQQYYPAGANITGIDFTEAMLATYALSVVPDPAHVLGEMARVCRSGGRIVMWDTALSDIPGVAKNQSVLRHFTSRGLPLRHLQPGPTR